MIRVFIPTENMGVLVVRVPTELLTTWQDGRESESGWILQGVTYSDDQTVVVQEEFRIEHDL